MFIGYPRYPLEVKGASSGTPQNEKPEFIMPKITGQSALQQICKERWRLFTSLIRQVILAFTLLSLSACDQRTNESANQLSNVEAVDQAAPLIYRPKLKLAANDPTVSEQFREAINVLRPKDQKTLEDQTPEQFVRARPLFLPLAEAGYVDAMLGMAATYIPHTIFFANEQIPYDWQQGIPWLTRAADAGHAEAQFALGMWYFHGEPVHHPQAFETVDWDKVNHYLTAAAEQGLLAAQNALGRLRGHGHDVAHLPFEEFMAGSSARDIEAYMWHTLAIRRYDPATEAERRAKGMIDRQALAIGLRDRMVREGEMTPEEIAEGQRRAEAWVRRHPDAYTGFSIPPELLLVNTPEPESKTDQ